MAEFQLIPESPLKGFSKNFGKTTLAEVNGFALVAIATPLEGERKLKTALKKHFGCAWPKVGQAALGTDGAAFLRIQNDMGFMRLPYKGDRADFIVEEKIGAAAYVTDQGDTWSELELKGPLALDALARLVMLDLSLASYPIGSVTRTLADHMGVILYRTGEDTFSMFAPSSFARNFLHAVEVSLEYVS